MFWRLRSSSRVTLLIWSVTECLLCVGVRNQCLGVGDLLQLLPRGVADVLVTDVCQQAVRVQGRNRCLGIVNMLLGHREIQGAIGGEFHLKAINIASGFDGLCRVDESILSSDGMLDDQGFRARIDVVDGIRFPLYLRRFGGQDTIVCVQFAHGILTRVQIGRNTGAEVDAIADEAFVCVLDCLDQRLAGICTRVEDCDGAAVKGLPCIVCQFGRVERIRSGGIRVDDQLARGDLLLKKWHHRRFVFTDGYRRCDVVFKEVGDFLRGTGLGDGARLRHLKTRGRFENATADTASRAAGQAPNSAVQAGIAAGAQRAFGAAGDFAFCFTAPLYTVGATA